MSGLQVQLAGHRAQVGDLQALRQGQRDFVEVGQLVAVGIDRPVIRVALQHPVGRVVWRSRAPRRQHRTIDVDLVVIAVLDQRHPVVDPNGLESLIQLSRGRVLLMELLEVVCWCVRSLNVAAAASTAAATQGEPAANSGKAG